MRRGGHRQKKYSAEALREVLGDIDPEITTEVRASDAEEAHRLGDLAREEYDYERTRNLYKLEVLYSYGDAEAVCRLATFLVDEYAIFDEAIRILESPACEIHGEGLRLLARAYYLVGDQKNALEVYQEVNLDGGDAISWRRQGKLFQGIGHYGDAIVAFEKALSFAATDSEAAKGMSACQQHIMDTIAPDLSVVERALQEKNLKLAGEALDKLQEWRWLPATYYRHKAAFERAVVEDKLTELLEQASKFEEEGELTQAMEKYREALTVDATCELARDRVSAVETRVVEAAASGWMGKGNRAFTSHDLPGAVRSYSMALTRGADKDGLVDGASHLFLLVQEFKDLTGKLPIDSQIEGIANLHRAFLELEAGNFEQAQILANRAGVLVEQLAAGRRFQLLQSQRRSEKRIVQAGEWMKIAEKAEEQSDIENAVTYYERVAKITEAAESAKALKRAAVLRDQLSRYRDTERVHASVDSLIVSQRYFLALRELGDHQDLVDSDERFSDLADAARRGVASKYPGEVKVVEQSPRAGGDVFRSGSIGIDGLDIEQVRAVRSDPRGSQWFIIAGQRLLLLDCFEQTIKLDIALPPQADLAGKNGFILADIAPGDRNSLVIINSDDDLLLHFQHSRHTFDLVNAMPFKHHLQQTRHQVTRWYTLNGPEEQILVCQSAPGAVAGTRIYGLSLGDGRMVQNDEHGHTLTNLRRVPGETFRYVIHRHPEPAVMPRPGYYSYVFLDSRLRFEKRGHIGPDELEGAFIESFQWLRIGPQSGNMYALARYYDAYSGQLVKRPLGFVALDPSDTLLYAAADSTTLVRNGGDLDPIAEVVVKEDGEFLAVVGRKKGMQYLFVVALEGFRLMDTIELGDDDRVVGLAHGKQSGSVVVVAISKDSGEVVLRTVTL